MSNATEHAQRWISALTSDTDAVTALYADDVVYDDHRDIDHVFDTATTKEQVHARLAPFANTTTPTARHPPFRAARRDRDARQQRCHRGVDPVALDRRGPGDVLAGCPPPGHTGVQVATWQRVRRRGTPRNRRLQVRAVQRHRIDTAVAPVAAVRLDHVEQLEMVDAEPVGGSVFANGASRACTCSFVVAVSKTWSMSRWSS